jgi:hypothetical protein
MCQLLFAITKTYRLASTGHLSTDIIQCTYLAKRFWFCFQPGESTARAARNHPNSRGQQWTRHCRSSNTCVTETSWRERLHLHAPAPGSSQPSNRKQSSRGQTFRPKLLCTILASHIKYATFLPKMRKNFEYHPRVAEKNFNYILLTFVAAWTGTTRNARTVKLSTSKDPYSKFPSKIFYFLPLSDIYVTFLRK